MRSFLFIILVLFFITINSQMVKKRSARYEHNLLYTGNNFLYKMQKEISKRFPLIGSNPFYIVRHDIRIFFLQGGF